MANSFSHHSKSWVHRLCFYEWFLRSKLIRSSLMRIYVIILILITIIRSYWFVAAVIHWANGRKRLSTNHLNNDKKVFLCFLPKKAFLPNSLWKCEIMNRLTDYCPISRSAGWFMHLCFDLPVLFGVKQQTKENAQWHYLPLPGVGGVLFLTF